MLWRDHSLWVPRLSTPWCFTVRLPSGGCVCRKLPRKRDSVWKAPASSSLGPFLQHQALCVQLLPDPLIWNWGWEDGGNKAIAIAINCLLSWPGVFTFCQPVWGMVGLEGKGGAPDTVSEFSISFSNWAAFVLAFDSHKTHCRNKIKNEHWAEIKYKSFFLSKKIFFCHVLFKIRTQHLI